MRQISLLIKPASSLCNMRCSYCFYKDEADLREQSSMGIMNNETIENLVKKVLALDVMQVNFCFQGGEPTLAKIDYFHYFIDCVNKYNNGKNITYAIQTNGLALNDSWFNLFKKHHFLVGISLDGFIENHDKNRCDILNKGTFNTILKNIKRIEEWEIDYNILTVLTSQLSKNPRELFEFYVKYQFKYIQLIPCLPSLDTKNPIDQYALQPTDFANFYKTFFDCWYSEYQKGNYISVTLFDQLIPMFLGVPPTLCGMLGKCHMQIVVEGDGSVYPCDFYALDQYCCGNITENSIDEIVYHEKAIKFVNEKQELLDVCKKCKYYKMCYGYCKRVNVCLKNNDYCGYQEFLDYAYQRLVGIAMKLRSK